MDIVITPSLTIPDSEIALSFARSSGAGGQNVNKVNTKVLLRWNLLRSPSMPDDVRQRFLALFRTRINDRGELALTSERYRSQRQNIDDCREKLRRMILQAATPPRKRRATRPGRASIEGRLRRKHRRSEIKGARRSRDWGRDD